MGILMVWLGVVYWEVYLIDLMMVVNFEGCVVFGLLLLLVIGVFGYIGGFIIVLFGVIVLC